MINSILELDQVLKKFLQSVINLFRDHMIAVSVRQHNNSSHHETWQLEVASLLSKLPIVQALWQGKNWVLQSWFVLRFIIFLDYLRRR